MLLSGLLLYIAGIVILALTGNPNLFPTVIMLGNFMVPAAYVAFFYERRHLSHLAMPETASCFLYGGVLGVFAAALVEPLLIRNMSAPNAFLVGLIEELAKILGVLFLTRRQRHDLEFDGLIVGAAAGMGFAALESTGYAFTALLQSGGSFSASVVVTLMRGLFAPVGHGTWTAILAAVLFRESGPVRFRLNGRVVIAYLIVSALHGLWDVLPVLFSMFVWPGFGMLIGQVLIGCLGILVLARRWREAMPPRVVEQALPTADLPA
jgi:RsiW-degrading membrane proteinase PrsW (M82 family)